MTENFNASTDFTAAAHPDEPVIARLYAWEAFLLDNRRFDEWLNLLHDELTYVAPTRYMHSTRERSRGVIARTTTEPLSDFDDDKASLRLRVMRLRTGKAWVDEPPSRTCHMVSNVLCRSLAGGELEALSHFHVVRARGNDDTDTWVGTRLDVLTPGGPCGWQVRRRVIDFVDLVIPSVSVFF